MIDNGSKQTEIQQLTFTNVFTTKRWKFNCKYQRNKSYDEDSEETYISGERTETLLKNTTG